MNILPSAPDYNDYCLSNRAVGNRVSQYLSILMNLDTLSFLEKTRMEFVPFIRYLVQYSLVAKIFYFQFGSSYFHEGSCFQGLKAVHANLDLKYIYI